MAEKGGDQPIILKKVNKGGHGHHGGAWKLAYADFVTALMAFFLVMWIVGMDFKTKHGLAEYFNNPGAFTFNFKSSPYMMNLDGKPPSAMDKVEAAARQNHNIDLEQAEGLASLLRTTIKNEPRIADLAKRIDITVTGDGLRIDFIEGTGGTFFKPDTAELKPEAKRAFQTLAPVLIGSKKKLEIHGHTDSGQLENLRYTKWELGADRGNVVRRALYEIGVPEDQIVSVASRADHMLRRQDDPRAIENNRIAILIPMTTE